SSFYDPVIVGTEVKVLHQRRKNPYLRNSMTRKSDFLWSAERCPVTGPRRKRNQASALSTPLAIGGSLLHLHSSAAKVYCSFVWNACLSRRRPRVRVPS